MARVYRNISKPVLILGLELVDLTVLIAVFLFLSNLSDRIFLNGLLVFCVYGVLRFLKKGKPEGYSTQLVKFILSHRFKQAALESPKHHYPKGRPK